MLQHRVFPVALGGLTMHGDAGSPVQPSPVPLLQLIHSSYAARAAHVAADLGVADALAAGPKRADEIAAEVGAEPRALYRVLRALASVGLFEEDEAHRFAITELGAYLRSDVAGSLRPLVVLLGSRLFLRSAEYLGDSVRTGTPGVELAFGLRLFDYLAQHPDAAAVFDAAMTSVTTTEVASILDAYNFSPMRTIIDVGGGQGHLLTAVLKAHPQSRGVLYDQPEVVAQAQDLIAAAGVAQRCEAIGGDFFQSVPSEGSVYVLKNVIHDWDDERATTILGKCRQAMLPDAKLLVIDPVVPPGNTPSPNKIFDLLIFLMTGGRERTTEEFQALFASAGLRMARVIPTKSRLSIIEAVVEATESP
jgi:hypothetical protein